MFAWLGEIASLYWYWISVVSFLAFGAVELFRPARIQCASITSRWMNHIALYGVDLAVMALIVPSVATTLISARTSEYWRPFTALTSMLGDGSVLLVGVLLLDLFTYWVHRLQHAVYFLWRFHAVHHSDTEMDVSTTLRHHPVAYIMVGALSALTFAALGLPTWVISIYAALTVSVGSFQHLNGRLPRAVEKVLGTVLITPDMHHVHHSADPSEYNANYGGILSIWDRIFRTYLVLPEHKQAKIAFGVEPFTTPTHGGALWAWILPFVIERGGAALPEILSRELSDSVASRKPAPVDGLSTFRSGGIARSGGARKT